jgi:methylated-DNA-[protein]-cysteine S-methyltransferase
VDTEERRAEVHLGDDEEKAGVVSLKCGMRNSEYEIEKKVFLTDFGWAGVAASDFGVCAVILPKKDKSSVEGELTNADCLDSAGKASAAARLIVTRAVTPLRRYFSGERMSFDLPLDLRYYTPFQRAVWTAVEEIPYGETRSYAWIAKKINRPRSARAVGQAMGDNPIPIIIP